MFDAPSMRALWPKITGSLIVMAVLALTILGIYDNVKHISPSEAKEELNRQLRIYKRDTSRLFRLLTEYESFYNNSTDNVLQNKKNGQGPINNLDDNILQQKKNGLDDSAKIHQLDFFLNNRRGKESNVLSSESSSNDDPLVFDLIHKMDGKCSRDLGFLLKEQYMTRKKRESYLMNLCGWRGNTDKTWIDILDKGKYFPGKVGKEGETPGASSLMMHIEYHEKKENIWFKTAPGNKYGERHMAQVAVFLLDRLLGLYHAVPSRGKVLEVFDTGLTDGVGRKEANIFLKKVKSHLDEKGNIRGAANAWVNRKMTMAKVNLPERSEIPGKIRPLTNAEKEEMEYQILLWFSGLTVYSHNFMKVLDFPIAFDTDRAFRSKPAMLKYFKNCQFPRHTVEYLWQTKKESEQCSLSSQLHQALNQDTVSPLGQELTNNLLLVEEQADEFLKIVQTCVDKFGQDKVLYSS